ncbi:MAG: hypothetical protein KDK23_03065 [Leptospiraceae bacterium]|nr:hypothetical protein [Leptospiraceae bacterium]
MSPYSQFLLKKYRALLQRAHRLIADSLHSSNPDIQLDFISESYSSLFEEIDETGTQLQEILEKERRGFAGLSGASRDSAGPGHGGLAPEIPAICRTHLRHIGLFLDAVDRNLSALKDRALRDVFENHVGDQIRAYLDDLNSR